MISFAMLESLVPLRNKPTGNSPLAIICLSVAWQNVEQQTLWLACQLHQHGRALTLVVRDNSPLHEQARAYQLDCVVFPANVSNGGVRAVFQLGRWLQQRAIKLLLVTRLADLSVGSLVKRGQSGNLRLFYRQLEPLSPQQGARRWLRNWQIQVVDA